jgi:hypothetical protein
MDFAFDGHCSPQKVVHLLEIKILSFRGIDALPKWANILSTKELYAIFNAMHDTFGGS